MVLSGHMHDFTSYDFGPGRPAQLIIGEGGDANDAIVQPVTAGITIDGMKVRRAFAMSDWGYVVLHRVAQGWTAAVYSISRSSAGALPDCMGAISPAMQSRIDARSDA